MKEVRRNLGKGHVENEGHGFKVYLISITIASSRRRREPDLV